MKLYLFYLFIGVSSSVYSSDTLHIKTSAQCHSCKNRLESRINKLKGVLSSSLDLETKIITIVIDTTQIHQENIIEKIVNTGYNANEKEASKSAYKRLPACCRKDYHGTH